MDQFTHMGQNTNMADRNSKQSVIRDIGSCDDSYSDSYVISFIILKWLYSRSDWLPVSSCNWLLNNIATYMYSVYANTTRTTQVRACGLIYNRV